jgi:hypothetical protein
LKPIRQHLSPSGFDRLIKAQLLLMRTALPQSCGTHRPFECFFGSLVVSRPKVTGSSVDPYYTVAAYAHIPSAWAMRRLSGRRTDPCEDKLMILGPLHRCCDNIGVVTCYREDILVLTAINGIVDKYNGLIFL